MGDTNNHHYFLFLSAKKISFELIDLENKMSFSKEDKINNVSTKNNIKLLEDFLDNNIFEIEKKMNNYVKKINLIIDDKSFFSVNLSVKYNFKGLKFELSQIKGSLIELKNQFKNTIGKYEIIHILISKFIIDKVEYSFLPEGTNYNNLVLEIRFICLKNNLILDLKKVLSKYQIELSKIVCYEYLKEFQKSDSENIYNIAYNVLRGINPNEIILVTKTKKNVGFFERFFNFFN